MLNSQKWLLYFIMLCANLNDMNTSKIPEFVKETNLTKAQLLGQEKSRFTKGQEESHLYWGNL